MDNFFLLKLGEHVTTEYPKGHYFVQFPADCQLQIISVDCGKPIAWYEDLFKNYTVTYTEILPFSKTAQPDHREYKSVLLRRILITDADGKTC